MTITDALRGEHGVLYRLLDHCAECSDAWDLEVARAAGGELEAALKTHAAIEDELLFTALDTIMPAGTGPLEVMRAEHEEIEGTLEELSRQADVQTARNLLRRLQFLAREHFAKEERVLFPMAEQRLGADRLEELGRVWSGRRGVSLG